MKRSVLYWILLLSVTIASCGGGMSGPVTSTAASAHSSSSASAVADSADSAGFDEARAIAYCNSTGGTYELRHAEYGTNNPNPLPLARWAGFCKYTSASDGSRIYILVKTLYATKPTLAVLAYLAKVPTGSCQGNPASCYCTLLGGSDQFGGTTGAGGGWVLQKSVDPVLEACIFPDLSSIDSWGLTYHANNIIRGINLAKVVRYHKS